MGENKSILIVDDAKLMRRLICDTLVENGFNVVGEAKDGREGVEMYKRLKPDLVTMDVVMENMDGLQALEKIKEYDKDAKVVMISAVNQRETLLKAIKLGAVDFIVKPFDSNRVISVVNKTVNGL